MRRSSTRSPLHRGEPDQAQAQALRIARADALANAGRCAEAGGLYLECLWGAPPDAALRLKTQAAKHLLNSGHVAEGTALWQAVLAAHGIVLPTSWEQSWVTLSRLLTAVFERGLRIHGTRRIRLRPGRARARRCVRRRLARRLDGRHQRTQQRAARLRRTRSPRAGRAASRATRPVHPALRRPAGEASGRPAFGARASAQLQAKLAELAARFADADSQAWVHLAVGTASFWRFDSAEALARFDAADALWSSQCKGVTRQLSIVRCMTLMIGRWGAVALDRNQARADRYLKEGLVRDDRYSAIWASDYRTDLILRSGDAQRARAELDRARQTWQRDGQLDYVVWTIWRNEIRLELYMGRPERALALVQAHWEAFMRSDIASGAAFSFLSLSDRIGALLAVARRCGAQVTAGPIDAELGVMSRLIESVRFRSEYWMACGAAAALRGERPAALQALQSAEKSAQELRFELRSCAIALARGRYAGDEEGRALADGAEAKLRAAGIGEPARWVGHLTGLHRSGAACGRRGVAGDGTSLLTKATGALFAN